MTEGPAANKIVNPILRGFNPDPSICRVGDDFYIATSTFEWYPGVQIHHSRDLRNWQLIARPLNEARLLNMLGTPDSCGVWAPCLTWSDDRFWLVFTDVKRFDGNFKDTHNFVTTAPNIHGPWSDPVYLNSSGFDPSLYHAEDGCKWLLNMVWDHRPDQDFFLGIEMQEYDPAAQHLVGEPERIFSGTELGCTEGPHIHRLGEYFYLDTESEARRVFSERLTVSHRVLAKELGGRNITVNAVSPGPVDTELFRDGKSEELINQMAQMTALGRLGQTADIADVVAFLASDDARWITGQSIHVNGGFV